MHSVYQRLSNLSALLSSCLLTLLAAITLSSLLFPASLHSTDYASLGLNSIKVHKGQKTYLSGMRSNIDTEFAFVKLNVSAGVSCIYPLFLVPGLICQRSHP